MTLWRVRATVDDRPGFLAVLTASLALRSVNILSVQVHGTESGAVDDFLVDAPDSLSEADLLAAVVRGRGRDPWVRRTEAHHLVDPPTEMLGAAARLVRDPDELPDALETVLLATVGRFAAPPEGFRTGFSGGRMQIPDPAGGLLLVERAAPPFTPAEYARAHALVDIATEVRRSSGIRFLVALPGGDEIELRAATTADEAAVAAMHGRCSKASIRARFLGGRVTVRLGAPHAVTLLAIGGGPIGPGAPGGEGGEGGQVLAAGTVAFDGPDAEVVLLVEDAVQGRGVGTALLRRLVGVAEQAGAEVVHAHAYRDNAAMSRTVERLGLPLRRASDGPVETISIEVRVPVA